MVLRTGWRESSLLASRGGYSRGVPTDDGGNWTRHRLQCACDSKICARNEIFSCTAPTKEYRTLIVKQAVRGCFCLPAASEMLIRLFVSEHECRMKDDTEKSVSLYTFVVDAPLIDDFEMLANSLQWHSKHYSHKRLVLPSGFII
jgi:hypothetical protein